MRRMPAEWEEHKATWLAWPHNKRDWPGMKMEPLWLTYSKIIETLISGEQVYLLVNDPFMHGHAHEFLWDAGIEVGQIRFPHVKTNSSWTRDWGPDFVHVSGTLARVWAIDWGFNGWGKEYSPWDKDDAAPALIAKTLSMSCIDMNDVVVEGGAIEVNGKGTLLTTDGCLNHKKRNLGKSRKDLEYIFREYLGATNTIWLPGKIAGDHTGHVDNLARFIYSNVVLCAKEDNPRDENYKALLENFQALAKARDEKGERFVVCPLPMPEPVYYKYQGEEVRLPASYANFYIANGVVLVPTFSCRRDEEALKIIEGFFPRRRVVGIDCRDLLWGMGTIHCSTLQEPA